MSIHEREFLNAYDQYADALFRHCYFRIPDRERAKDLVQETFTKTWEYLVDGKEVKNMRAFLYRVATNLVIDEARKKKPISLDLLQEEKGFDPGHDPLERTQHMIDAKTIVSYLSRLDPHHKEVVVMRYIDGLGPKEIAKILGETENTVSVRLHRAIQRLRSLVTAYE